MRTLFISWTLFLKSFWILLDLFLWQSFLQRSSSQESCSSSLTISTNIDPSSHILSTTFSSKEITSEIFPVPQYSVLGGISIVLLQNISNKAADCLLFWVTSGCYFLKQYVIVLSPFLSLTLLSLILDRSLYLPHYVKLLNTLWKFSDGFKKKTSPFPIICSVSDMVWAVGTMECFLYLVGPFYKLSCKKENLFCRYQRHLWFRKHPHSHL